MGKLRAFFQSIKDSLANPQYYNQIKSQSFGSNLSYLYFLLVLIGFVFAITISIPLFVFVPQVPGKVASLKEEAKNAYPQDLILTVKNGELSANVKQPYFYKNMVVIDTNAKVDDYPTYKDKAPILVTKTAVVYPGNSASKTEIFFLSELQQDFTLDKDLYLKGVAAVEPYLNYAQPLLIAGILFILLLGPFIGAGFSLLEKLISLLIFSFVFLLVMKIMKKVLTFSEIYKMAMHASTLPIIFFSILGIFGLQPGIPFGYSLLLALVMGVILNRLWTKSS